MVQEQQSAAVASRSTTAALWQHADSAHLLPYSKQGQADMWLASKHVMRYPTLTELAKRGPPTSTFLSLSTSLRKSASSTDYVCSDAFKPGGTQSLRKTLSDNAYSASRADTNLEQERPVQLAGSSGGGAAFVVKLAEEQLQQQRRQLAVSAVPDAAHTVSSPRQSSYSALADDSAGELLGMLRQPRSDSTRSILSSFTQAQPASGLSDVHASLSQQYSSGAHELASFTEGLALTSTSTSSSTSSSTGGLGGIKARFATATANMQKLSANVSVRGQALAGAAAAAYADSTLVDTLADKKQQLLQRASTSDAAAFADRLAAKSQDALRRAAASDAAAVASARATNATIKAADCAAAMQDVGGKTSAWLKSISWFD